MRSDFPPDIPSLSERALIEAGYFTLDQLTRVTVEEILQLHGVGPKAISILEPALREKGLSFAQKIKST